MAVSGVGNGEPRFIDFSKIAAMSNKSPGGGE